MRMHAPDTSVEVYEGLKYYREEESGKRAKAPKTKKVACAMHPPVCLPCAQRLMPTETMLLCSYSTGDAMGDAYHLACAGLQAKHLPLLQPTDHKCLH